MPASESQRGGALTELSQEPSKQETERLDEASNLALISTSRALHQQQLCNICEPLDLSSCFDYSDPRNRISVSVLLGTKEDLKDRIESCCLCKLVHILLMVPTNDSFDGAVSLEICWPSILKVRIGTNVPFSFFLGPLQVIDIVPHMKEVFQAYFGRRHFNFDAVRSQLRVCESSHSDKCNEVFGRETELKILLIDTQEMRIVEGTTQFRFFALSYVWGGTKTMSLTQSNLDLLRKPGSLIRFQNEIPQLIHDAICIIRVIGERYLWCDALCIVQDDGTHKHNQIRHMDCIYSQATMTMLAISANNANHGLLSWDKAADVDEFLETLARVQTQKHVKVHVDTQLSHDVFSLKRPSLDRLLKSSTYETRGWTLQERLLSRRALYITDYEVVFDCRYHLIEEKGHETWRQKSRILNPLWSDRYRNDAVQGSSREKSIRYYSSLVKVYTSRTLSYQSDALQAFAGVMGALRNLQNAEAIPAFICGLPCNNLARGLFWVSKIDTSPDYDGQSPEKGKILIFPSWSWARHSRNITYPFCDESPNQWSNETIKAVGATQSEYTQLATMQSSDLPPIKPPTLVWNDLASWPDINSDDFYILHFWAERVKWKHFQIYDKAKRGHEFNEMCTITEYEGYGKSKVCGEIALSPQELSSYSASNLYLISLFTVGVYTHKIGFMLVCYLNGFYERVSIGYIDAWVWRAASPCWSLINLS